MKVSIEKEIQNQKKFMINRSQVTNWTYRKRKALLSLIDTALDPLTRIVGIFYICAGSFLFYLSIVSFTPVSAWIIEFVLTFSGITMMFYGYQTYKMRFMVNRKEFIDSAQHEIEKEMQEKLDSMESRALSKLTQKIVGSIGDLKGFDGIDVSLERIDTATDVLQAKKTAKVRKDKKKATVN